MKRILAAAITLALGCAALASNVHASPLAASWACTLAICGVPEGKPIVEQLLPPPEVPARITRHYPAKVIVNLEARKVVGTLADGVKYDFYTFNGTVPGPMIRVRVGDTVEIRLKNAHSDHMPHNIDLHAVMGTGGGATDSIVIPGHEGAFEFKALHAGFFVYHCAMAPAAVHI
ncbi:MAG: multicopper oxidase domain-containing protein, partial [Metallibacterium scheffleri]